MPTIAVGQSPSTASPTRHITVVVRPFAREAVRRGLLVHALQVVGRGPANAVEERAARDVAALV